MPRRENEVWRLPPGVRGEDVRLGTRKTAERSPALSAAARERLARIARRTPEVMVKITGRSRGIAGLKSHFDYITRNGRLEGETNDGTPVQDRVDLRRLHDDWLLTNAVTGRGRTDLRAAQSVGIILSMPKGTPGDRVHEAARRWVRETFHDQHDWLLVRHDDKGHPHVHVTVRAVGSNGKRLAPGPADLQEWRERFAQQLRQLGIAAEATPRQARGKVQRAERTPVHRIEQRGAEPKVRRLQRDDASREAGRPSGAATEWQRAIQARQETIRRAYLRHAADLENGDGADRLLAADIRRFVADLPVPLTRRQLLATELRHIAGRQADREPPEPPRATLTRDAATTEAQRRSIGPELPKRAR